MNKKICIGIPVYNGSPYLRPALDALLGQSFGDFHVIILNDGSSDDSLTILELYAKMDARISLFHNLNRTGLIASWNKVALLAGELCRPDFFAWYSDHDWIDRCWLEKLSQILEEDSNTVLAHAKTVLVNRDGNIVDGSRSILDTTHMSSLSAVRAVTLEYYGAGDVIYGLFRYPVLRQCHFLPKEFLPDRLTVSEISLRGTIRYAPDVTRFRRDLSPDNYSKVLLERQSQTLFSSDAEVPKAPMLRHGTYFLRQFLDSSHIYEEKEHRALRLIHAYLYLVRQFNRYGEQWENEIEDVRMCEDLFKYLPLMEFLVQGKWLPITDDAYQRLKEYKSRCKELHKNLNELRVRVKHLEQRQQELETEISQMSNENL